MNFTVTLQPIGAPGFGRNAEIGVGASVAEAVAQLLPQGMRVSAWLPGQSVLHAPVDPAWWPFVRPKAGTRLLLNYRMAGGGRGNLFASVALLALAVAAPGIGGALAAGLGFSATGFAASAISAGLVIGGALLVGKLFPPERQMAEAVETAARFRDVSSDVNPAGRDAMLPIVLGRRISPPDITDARIRVVDGVETVERLFALGGPHEITDIEVDGTPVTDFPAITTQVLDGSDAAGTYTFVDTISSATQIGETLSNFIADGVALEDQDDPENSEPRWVHFTTPGHESLDEVVIRWRLTGFFKTDSGSQNVRVPIQRQVRPKGGGDADWISLPEQHIIGRDVSPLTYEDRYRWDAEFGEFDIGGAVTCELWQRVPPVTASALSDGNTGDQWQADSHFVGGSGLQDTANIEFKRHGLRAVFTEAVLPRGALEWRMRRGVAVNDSTVTSAYVVGAVVDSLFVARTVAGVWQMPLDQGSYTPQVNLLQAVAVADEHPCQLPGTALVALRARGQSVNNVTFIAHAADLDWNGSAWATAITQTSNPATRYYNFLRRHCQRFGISLDCIDSASIVAWRQECIARGYTCAAVYSGESLQEVLAGLAAAGLARPVYGAQYSVDWFRDRSSETPAQTFSPRNGASIRFDATLPDRQAGYRIKFADAADDYRETEIEVVLDNATDVAAFVPLDLSAVSDETHARRLGMFQLLQEAHRRRRIIVETAVEGVVCKPGDLVSVISDLFDDRSHGVRIRQVIDGSTLALDQVIPPVASESFADSPAIADLFSVGESSRIFVSTPDGVEERLITGASGNIIVLDAPLEDGGGDDWTDADLRGQHCNIVNTGNAKHRCFVLSIEALPQERARLVLVDEAPEIYQTLLEAFG